MKDPIKPSKLKRTKKLQGFIDTNANPIDRKANRIERLRKKFNLSTAEEEVLIKSAKIASSKAIRSSKALGITIKIIRNNKIIEVHPDQSEKIIRTISKSKTDTSSLKKGMVLERRKQCMNQD